MGEIAMPVKNTKPPTKYCIFQMSLAGYDVFIRKSGKKVMKLDLFNNFCRPGREKEMELIIDRQHPYFIFQKREEKT